MASHETFQQLSALKEPTSFLNTSTIIALSVFFTLLCACIIIGPSSGREPGLCAGATVLLLSKGRSSPLLLFSEDLFFLYLLPPIIFNAGLGSSRSYSNGVSNAAELYSWNISSCLCKDNRALPWAHGNAMILRSSLVSKSMIFVNDKRFTSTQAKATAPARQMGAFKVSMLSPGIIYEPYAPREPISFLRRWFTRDGWRRTKDDMILELKSAYAISKLRKSGYSKKKFYTEAADLYKEINTLMANGDKTSIRKTVTENMYSALKNEIKLRESKWSSVYWELVEPIIKIRTLRARLIGVDRSDLSKVFVQLTLEILSKQKFEACDPKGVVVAGDKTKEVLVRDIWVFEKSLFHPGAHWRLCGRIKI